MTNIVKLTVDVTAVDILTPVLLDKTPVAGGAGREAIVRVPTAPLTSVFKLQGHDGHGINNGDGTWTPPAENDAGWADVATINATSEKIIEVADLPRWIRANVTTLDADGPDVLVYIEGVQ